MGMDAHLCKTQARTEPAADPTGRGQCHCVPAPALPSAPGIGHTLLGGDNNQLVESFAFLESFCSFPRRSHHSLFQPLAPWGKPSTLPSNQLLLVCEDRISQTALFHKRILWAKRFRERLYTRSPIWRSIMCISILEDMRSPIGNKKSQTLINSAFSTYLATGGVPPTTPHITCY